MVDNYAEKRNAVPMLTQSTNAFDLNGETALITGAGGRLGVEHAEALLAGGATVIVTDIEMDALAETVALLRK